ncbi:MAG: RdgB/HAM1 family non-canonical purine NTP pyrophosphatase [Xanthomonadales bacterium]|nr:RdgB/HAM1 family non-canonical purine NTP pyrophosphatase [Xanthomonadales bacterium]
MLATGNPGKLSEIRAILAPYHWAVHAQSEWDVSEAAEDGLSFVENALIKARHAARHTGLPALGDDSGLVVAALQGRPGIRSARFAGPAASPVDNNRKLLAALENVSGKGRGAHFYCAMALLRHAEDPAPMIATGIWHGEILRSPTGSGGFGYDPLFYVPGQGCSAAELAPGIKNRLSHRAKALAALVDQMLREYSA